MADRQGLSYTATAQAEFNPQLFGLFLGLVTMTRTQDLWVMVNIPQIFGTESSNWARPIGFNGAAPLAGGFAGITVIPQSPATAASATTATTAAATTTTTGTSAATTTGSSAGTAGTSTSGGTSVTGSTTSTTSATAATATTAASATSSGSGQPLGIAVTEVGPGPPVGTLVICCFIGGDRNRPGYFITSQSVSGAATGTTGTTAGATSAATSTANLTA